MPFSVLKVHRRFEGTSYIHLQGRIRNLQEASRKLISLLNPFKPKTHLILRPLKCPSERQVFLELRGVARRCENFMSGRKPSDLLVSLQRQSLSN
jgi:hypothetical protein